MCRSKHIGTSVQLYNYQCPQGLKKPLKARRPVRSVYRTHAVFQNKRHILPFTYLHIYLVGHDCGVHQRLGIIVI